MYLAVIMSVYDKDHPDQVKEAIESLQKQTMDSFHCYIVEDGQLKDELIQVLSSFEDKRIIRRHKDNSQGLAMAMNDLLKEVLSKGYKYIARMDADDISLPERFEHQTKFLEENPQTDSCGTFAVEIDEYGNKLFDKVMPITHEECKHFFKQRSCYIHPTVMFKRSFFEKAGLYPHEILFCEDVLLWLNGFKNNCIFHNIPEYLLYFRINKGFYKRRKGLKNSLRIWKARKKITQEMGYGFLGYIYAFIYSVTKLLPRVILKELYKLR